jgi:PAS domain S-box-containing protein
MMEIEERRLRAGCCRYVLVVPGLDGHRRAVARRHVQRAYPCIAASETLELLPDALFIVAGAEEGGTIRYINSQASQMFGYDPDELVNQSIDLLVPGSMKEIIHERPRSVRWGAGLELRGRRRHGSEFPVGVLRHRQLGYIRVPAVRQRRV